MDGELLGKTFFGIGDPWGLIDVGPSGWGGIGGIDLREDSRDFVWRYGVGGDVRLLEGMISLEGAHLWSSDGSRGPRVGLNLDVLSWLRFFNVIDRDK